MYRLTSKLVIYRNMGEDSILFRLADICQRFAAGNYVKENLITDIYVEIHRLLDISTRYGFDKNLWHNYLAFILAMSENPFTMVSEKVGANQGTVNEFAKSDFKIFKQLFDYDFSAMEKELEINCFSVVTNYKAVVKSEQIFNRSVSEKVQELSDAIAQAADFIEEKQEKYDSDIAQGGSNVSGGQKQRLAIARAIAKQPKIYVFDDSFSALDLKTDAALRKALASKVKDSTVIIVAQRISTILHAEQILVLDDGKIVGKGTHEELLKNCETYQQIARSQLSAKELGIEESEVSVNE